MKKCLGFLVSWLLVVGFLVSEFLGFLVSKFLSFKDSKSSNVFERYWFHITRFPFHFLTDVALIFKIFKIVLGGPSFFFGARLFYFCSVPAFSNIFKMLDVTVAVYENNICSKRFQG